MYDFLTMLLQISIDFVWLYNEVLFEIVSEEFLKATLLITLAFFYFH